MDRVFCLSDTFDSNKKMLENLAIRPEDILSPNDPDAIDKIVAEIDKERDDLFEYREKVIRWKSFNKKWSAPCAIFARFSSSEEVCRRASNAARVASEAGPTVMRLATARVANCDEAKLRSEEESGRSGPTRTDAGRAHLFQPKKVGLLVV